MRLLQRCRQRVASLPVRGAWIEMRLLLRCRQRFASLPVRGAWIEILRVGVLLA